MFQFAVGNTLFSHRWPIYIIIYYTMSSTNENNNLVQEKYNRNQMMRCSDFYYKKKPGYTADRLLSTQKLLPLEHRAPHNTKTIMIDLQECFREVLRASYHLWTVVWSCHSFECSKLHVVSFGDLCSSLKYWRIYCLVICNAVNNCLIIASWFLLVNKDSENRPWVQLWQVKLLTAYEP